MAGPYRQLADPQQLAAANDMAQSPELWQQLMQAPQASTRAPFVAGSTNTPLHPLDEMAFRQWVQSNKVPFNPEAKSSDYDMRGFWQALQNKDPRAQSAVDPNDNRLHYPDYWKTPQHETFSNESQWATPGTPGWVGDKLVTPGGRVLFDDQNPPQPFLPTGRR